MITTSTVSALKFYRTIPMYWYQSQLWIIFFCGGVFILLSLVSLQCVMNRLPRGTLAQIAAPLHFMSSSLALLSFFTIFDSVAYSFIYTLQPFHFLPIALVFLDMALGSRMRFRLVYFFLPQLFLLTNTLLWILAFNSTRKGPYYLTTIPWFYYAIWHAVLIGTSMIMIFFSRLSDICIRKRGNNRSDASVASDFAA
eukprot:IDg15635t1